MGGVAVRLQRAARHQFKSPVCSAACRTILAYSKHIGFPLHNSSRKIARLSLLQLLLHVLILHACMHTLSVYSSCKEGMHTYTQTCIHVHIHTYVPSPLCLPLSLSTPLGENNETRKKRGSACERHECVGSLWGGWQTDKFVPSLTQKLIFHGNAATLNEAIGCACIRGAFLEEYTYVVCTLKYACHRTPYTR